MSLRGGGGGGGAKYLKVGAQGGRDPQGFGPGEDEIPKDLAPGGRDHGGGGRNPWDTGNCSRFKKQVPL